MYPTPDAMIRLTTSDGFDVYVGTKQVCIYRDDCMLTRRLQNVISSAILSSSRMPFAIQSPANPILSRYRRFAVCYTSGQDIVDSDQIPLDILQIVVDWCTYQANGRKPISKSARARITPWEKRFFEDISESKVIQVMHAADRMGINYLLTVCCQIAITTHHVLRMCTTDSRHMGSSQNLSFNLMEYLLLEQAIQDNRLLVEELMRSAEGRTAFAELQRLRRQRMFRRYRSPHIGRQRRVEHHSEGAHGSVVAARTRILWERENTILQRTLEWSSYPCHPLAEALNVPATRPKLSIDQR
jgi:hypothetical protein